MSTPTSMQCSISQLSTCLVECNADESKKISFTFATIISKVTWFQLKSSKLAHLTAKYSCTLAPRSTANSKTGCWCKLTTIWFGEWRATSMSFSISQLFARFWAQMATSGSTQSRQKNRGLLSMSVNWWPSFATPFWFFKNHAFQSLRTPFSKCLTCKLRRKSNREICWRTTAC